MGKTNCKDKHKYCWLKMGAIDTQNELASCFLRLSSWAWAIWILESDFLLLWCGVSSLKVRLLNPKGRKKRKLWASFFCFESDCLVKLLKVESVESHS